MSLHRLFSSSSLGWHFFLLPKDACLYLHPSDSESKGRGFFSRAGGRATSHSLCWTQQERQTIDFTDVRLLPVPVSVCVCVCTHILY